MPPIGERPTTSKLIIPQLKRKALLIGITYEKHGASTSGSTSGSTSSADSGSESDAEDVLVGPHQDVNDMYALLIEKYGYNPKDIVKLMDTDDPDQLQPTRANIMGQIQKLVEGALPGDSFFFLYAGHSFQVENRDGTEEDGLDEYLLPVEGEEGIRDNELREHLVDSLPAGCQLIAVFDSCHSGSLLDLPHHRCNRVWVPWISKGKRRSNSRWNINVRKDAACPSRNPYRSKRISSPHNIRARKTLTEDPKRRRPLRHTQDTVVGGFPFPAQRSPRSSHNTGFATPSHSHSQSGGKKPEGAGVGIQTRARSSPAKASTQTMSWSILGSPGRRTASPVSEYCTGFCPRMDDDVVGGGMSAGVEDGVPPTRDATVICLASCKDGQVSWENKQGASMTQALITVLREHEEPTLGEVLAYVSHFLHAMYIQLHTDARGFRERVKAVNKYRAKKGLKALVPTDHPEMDNFQDPQLSSHRPLNMDAQWIL